MRKVILVLALVVSASVALTACSGSSTKTTETSAKVQYTCSMHPEVVQDKPGTCPTCEMDLIEKK